MGFKGSVRGFVQRTKLREQALFHKLGFDGFTGVVMISPVREGRFRGNWRIGINQPNLTVEPKGDPSDPGQGESLTSQERSKSAEILKARIGDSILVTNNSVYGPRLNVGYSPQAPDGILDPVAEQLSRNFAEAVNRAKTDVPFGHGI